MQQSEDSMKRRYSSKLKVPQHNHLLVNAKSDEPVTKTRELRKFLNKFVHDIGMYRIKGPIIRHVYTPGNRGLTAVVMIETSHIALHIWDEPQPAHIQFDVYTCAGLNIKHAMRQLIRGLRLTEVEWVFFDRQVGFVQKGSGKELSEFETRTRPDKWPPSLNTKTVQ
jgi:S-adenosylmethionine/arginine decarboxylase-like enzyme